MTKFVFAAKTIGGAIFSITIVEKLYADAFKKAKSMAEGCNVYPLVSNHGFEQV